ncbi:VOC family protein [Catellatospora vulcania]|uniref:VOC family protein n=1 Tax=Catellatospora vulcania TaxID=1460450 RepID=UPI0038B2F7C8
MGRHIQVTFNAARLWIRRGRRRRCCTEGGCRARVHLDLHAGPDRRDGEGERKEALGATVLRRCRSRAPTTWCRPTPRATSSACSDQTGSFHCSRTPTRRNPSRSLIASM